MIGDFLSWWLGQLRDCVPERWRNLALSGGDALVVAPAGLSAGGVEAAEVSLRHNGRETALGRFDLASGGLAELPPSAPKQAVLQLTEADVLSKTLTLPLGTERQLDQVLAFEMDRETPFSPEEIFWNHHIAQRDKQRGLLSVRLLLVPRSGFAGLLEALAKAGIAPKRAEIASGPDRGCYLPLDADGGGPHDAAIERLRWRWPAVACCAALALAVIVAPFVRQSLALGAVYQQLDAGRDAAAAAEKMRAEIDRLTRQVNLIDSERNNAGRPLETLATLTRLLPDDTYLTDFQQQHNKLTLSGSSAGASRLIGALASSKLVHDPAFAAPVTRVEATKSEVFTITAEVGSSLPQ